LPLDVAAHAKWLSTHPGGQYLFCHELEVWRSRRKRVEFAPASMTWTWKQLPYVSTSAAQQNIG
jgi:hypothetical protein